MMMVKQREQKWGNLVKMESNAVLLFETDRNCPIMKILEFSVFPAKKLDPTYFI